MAISSPAYSFVRFNQPAPRSCGTGYNAATLPVKDARDLKFQVISTSGISSLQVVKLDGTIVSSNSGFTYAGNNVYLWAGSLNIAALQDRECFRLKIGTALSNVFTKRVDDCFTTLLRYSNDGDYAGFLYCDISFTNQVRLDMHLTAPKMNESRSVYLKSEGTLKLIASRLSKEYTALTEFMTEVEHDALAVAMTHKSVYITSERYTGYVSKIGDMSPSWDGADYMAPLEFKLQVTPLDIKNGSCDPCAEDIVITPPPGGCVAANIPATTLTDAVENLGYNKVIALTGTAPFSLSSVTKPAFVSVILSGSNVTIGIDPQIGEAGVGYSVSFNVSNACGSDSFSETFDVWEYVGNPSIIFISNTIVINLYRRHEIQIGQYVSAGNTFKAGVYGYVVTYVAVNGDTPSSVAAALAAAINDTTDDQWRSINPATVPAPGTAGYEPEASASGDHLIVTVDKAHQFFFSATT